MRIAIVSGLLALGACGTGSESDARSAKPYTADSDGENGSPGELRQEQRGVDAGAVEDGHDAGTAAPTDAGAEVEMRPEPGTACAEGVPRTCDTADPDHILACADGSWAVVESCPQGNHCDSRRASTHGQCIALVPECEGQPPGRRYCRDQDVMKCIDRFTAKVQTTCPAPSACLPDVAVGAACSTVNECADDTDNCSSEPDACVDTRLGFSCQCPDGYEGEGIGEGGCQDIDECAAGAEAACGEGVELCMNTAGGYECSCKQGLYRRSEEGRCERRKWSEPTTLSLGGGEARYSGMAIDSNRHGDILLAYQQDGDIYVWKVDLQDSAPTSERVNVSDTLAAGTPQVALADGLATIAWLASRDWLTHEHRFRARRVQEGTPVGQVADLTTRAGVYITDKQVAVDRDGNAVFAWRERSTDAVVNGTAGPPYELTMAQKWFADRSTPEAHAELDAPNGSSFRSVLLMYESGLAAVFFRPDGSHELTQSYVPFGLWRWSTPESLQIASDFDAFYVAKVLERETAELLLVDRRDEVFTVLQFNASNWPQYEVGRTRYPFARYYNREVALSTLSAGPGMVWEGDNGEIMARVGGLQAVRLDVPTGARKTIDSVAAASRPDSNEVVVLWIERDSATSNSLWGAFWNGSHGWSGPQQLSDNTKPWTVAVTCPPSQPCMAVWGTGAPSQLAYATFQ